MKQKERKKEGSRMVPQVSPQYWAMCLDARGGGCGGITEAEKSKRPTFPEPHGRDTDAWTLHSGASCPLGAPKWIHLACYSSWCSDCQAQRSSSLLQPLPHPSLRATLCQLTAAHPSGCRLPLGEALGFSLIHWCDHW